MSNKADLLKRYGNAAANDGKKKRRKKKQTGDSGTIRVVEDSDDYIPNAKKLNHAWEDAEAEDELPVVIDESGAVVHAKAGSWGVVARDPSPPRRKPARHDSPDPSPPRRKPVLHDSPDPSPPRRKPARHDSPDPSPPRRKPARHVNPAESSQITERGTKAHERAKTASGHTAGLMKADEFIKEDRRIRAEQMAAAAASGGGDEQQQETVYRDKRGRKLDMLNQMMRQQAIAEGKAVAEETEQYEWGKGTVQKAEERQHEEELRNIAAEPFARTRDDPKVDALFRDKIHADDPMAQYMLKKRDEAQRNQAKARGAPPAKPRYKGPAPRPNRFGIPPGYRWDGRDRGSAWEERVLGEAAAKMRFKDAQYQYSVSDM